VYLFVGGTLVGRLARSLATFHPRSILLARMQCFKIAGVALDRVACLRYGKESSSRRSCHAVAVQEESQPYGCRETVQASPAPLVRWSTRRTKDRLPA